MFDVVLNDVLRSILEKTSLLKWAQLENYPNISSDADMGKLNTVYFS